jgi:hypothetical protein
MSLFGKKPEPPPLTQASFSEDEPPSTPGRAYGVADLIRLLKTIPVDQHPDLVVRVVKTTLESVGVHSSHVIDDAVRLETAIADRIGVLEGEIQSLTGEIQLRRDQIGQLQVELSETTYAKERLQSAEAVSFGNSTGDPGAHAPKPRSLPPPLPPPLHKSGKPPEPATGT